MDDRELIMAYAEMGDQEAFAQVVREHGDWVYGSARRQLGDEHLAEDVTQAVFLLLARRAGRLKGYAYLGGWLVKAAQYCVKEAKRERGRRERREKEVAEMRREAMPVEASWDEVAVVLDEAVAGLRPADREAVLMRFYRGMGFVEVGARLGISEKAAQKRVERAVEKLREMLGKKGVRGTTAGLSAVLVGNVVGQMPAVLLGRIVSAIGSGGVSTVPAGITRGVMKMMAYAKMKVAAVIVGATILVGSAGLTAALVAGRVTTVATTQGHSPAPALASAPPIEGSNMLFTDRARNVMAVANQEAEQFNHDYIGTEHILLGLVEERDSAGANVLKSLGADLPKVRAEIEKSIESGPGKPTMENRPQTPRAKMVIQYAMDEAGALNQKYVGTEHILLGLLDAQDGTAAQSLRNLGVNPDMVRAAVLRQLRPGVETPEAQQRPEMEKPATP